MGTGFVATTKLSPDIKPTILPSGNVLLSPQLSQPDLLTDHNSSINGTKSTQTTTTSIASEASNGSYRAAMESIIHDYKLVSYFTFFKISQTRPLFCFILFFSHDKYSTNTITDKSLDGVLVTTRGSRMVGNGWFHWAMAAPQLHLNLPCLTGRPRTR